jgi:transposase
MPALTRSNLQVIERQPGDVAEFRRRIKVERDALQRDKYRAVMLALEGRGAPAITRALGRSRRAVQDWVYAYRDGGIDELLAGKSTGQPTKLRRDQEPLFRTRLEPDRPRPTASARCVARTWSAFLSKSLASSTAWTACTICWNG